jgi:hypothetical protein
VLVHPSDLVVSGREIDAAHARAIFSEHLTVTKAYLTWDKEANEVEDRLREIWDALRADRLDGLADRLDAIERQLRALTLPYEEWEALFRQTLMAQRTLLRKPATAFVKTARLRPPRRRDAGGRRGHRQAGGRYRPRGPGAGHPAAPPTRPTSLPERLAERVDRLLPHQGRGRLKRFLRRAA